MDINVEETINELEEIADAIIPFTPLQSVKNDELKTIFDAIDLLKGQKNNKERVGKWVEEKPNSYSRRISCSVCNGLAPFVLVSDDYYGRSAHGEYEKTKHCPNCGVKMVE